MASQARIPDSEMDLALRKLPGWQVVNGKLHREYRFADFVYAFGFMTAAALRIQTLDHHPEWTNVYNRVTVDLVTHDANGITAKDLDLAAQLEEIAAKLQ